MLMHEIGCFPSKFETMPQTLKRAFANSADFFLICVPNCFAWKWRNLKFEAESTLTSWSDMLSAMLQSIFAAAAKHVHCFVKYPIIFCSWFLKSCLLLGNWNHLTEETLLPIKNDWKHFFVANNIGLVDEDATAAVKQAAEQRKVTISLIEKQPTLHYKICVYKSI